MRNILVAPKERITQGTIFTGVRRACIGENSCHGIAITARCDTARDFKASALTFLPIIPFENWMWEEALPKCIENQKNAAIGSLRKYLEKTQGTAIALEAFGAERAFQVAGNSDKGVVAAREQYLDSTDRVMSIAPKKWSSLPSTISKRLLAEAKLLFTYKNQEFFFVEKVENFEDAKNHSPSGYVVCLREVRTLSRELALKIASGLDSAALSELSAIDPTVSELCLDATGIALPVSELKSPYIEHLMQSFSILYGRIGVKNVSDSYVETIAGILGVEL